PGGPLTSPLFPYTTLFRSGEVRKGSSGERTDPVTGTRASASGARYEQIAEQIRESIRTGQRQVGQLLESEAALAADYHVAPGTVREALRLLVSEGTVGGRRGARKVVLRKPRPAAVAEELRS